MKNNDLKFTGERFIPGQTDPILALEHYHRYLYASPFVKGKKVLDIACGEGYGTAFLSQYAEQVTGADIDAETIEFAKNKYSKFKNATFVTVSCEELTSLKQNYDVIVSFETLEHLDSETQKLFLKNITTILSKNGVLIISSPEKETYGETREFSNEFHKHELSHNEFLDFLSSYFSYVSLAGQRALTLSSLWSLDDWKNQFFKFNIREKLLKPAINCKNFTKPVYLIAVCSNQNVSDTMKEIENSFYYDIAEIERIKPIFSWAKSLESEVKNLKDHSQKLLTELEDRTNWAKRLDSELSESREAYMKLQKEYEERTEWAKRLDKELNEAREIHQKLQQEFDERSNWAKRLDKELNEAREIHQKLQQEFDERSNWAISLDRKLQEEQKKLHELREHLNTLELKNSELQVWGELINENLKRITSSPMYRLLAAIGLLPKHSV